ncbi:helix-turn-helix domain-containing protein [Xylanibacter rodentium]|uniref:helix-turn-helix domain-containing protein n=1 Tax=Xylanibacter rodentium TaxID=2736289 RepID=UPI0033150E69
MLRLVPKLTSTCCPDTSCFTCSIGSTANRRNGNNKLDITKRALQDYRDRGLISYYRLDGKILYSEDDVDEFLRASYRPKFY